MNISNTHTYHTPTTQHKMLSDTSSRSWASLKKKKLLPHIHQQYSFRVTNRLLIYKIMHPRRDKNIMDSLLHTSLTHNLNTHSQISALGSHCRKNISTKKQQPTQRPLFKVENESVVFVQNKSVFKTQNEKESDCNWQNDRTNPNTEMINYDRRQPTNTNRERRAGRIMKNNFLGLNTVESMLPEKSATVEGVFKMQQKQSEAAVGEIMEQRGKLRRNLRVKVKCSIEQCQ